MPRRQFFADLDNARNSILPSRISDVKAGDDDGLVEFLFSPEPGLSCTDAIKITAMVSELSDYPGNHEYMIFGDDTASPQIAQALQRIKGVNGKSLDQLLDTVSSYLRDALAREGEDTGMSDAPESQESSESDDDADIYDSDHEAFTDIPPAHIPSITAPLPPAPLSSLTRVSRARIRADLRTAKSAGFRISYLGHLLEGHNCYVTLAIRMRKLGISEEAMQAWKVDPLDYLMLVIQYPSGYRTNEELQSYAAAHMSAHIGMRVVASKRYKLTFQDAIRAFSVVATDRRDTASLSDIPGPGDLASADCSICDTFISKPLAGLLNERLVHILRYRSSGMSWFGAESWYNEEITQGFSMPGAQTAPSTCFEPERVPESFPRVVRSDHYLDKTVSDYSFPLLAMQFLLRHFVRCTEFCLVCHRKLDMDIEAIKPYVCERGLCLYQYMALGFGPSIEHEILSQPYVVDLLVSFAYASAAAQRLTELPDALALVVPFVPRPDKPIVANYRLQQSAEPPLPDDRELHKYNVRFDRTKMQMTFSRQPKQCPVKQGNWIVLKSSSNELEELHCRVSDTKYFPTISLHEPIVLPLEAPGQAQTYDGFGVRIDSRNLAGMTPPSHVETCAETTTATFHIYDQAFDQLPRVDKCVAICKILDTLPTVKEMQDYLVTRRANDLKRWFDRISPCALSLLRWIIASNRACIMQVDGNDDHSPDPTTSASQQSGDLTPRKDQGRVSGMKGFFQFRFAMGAPDKEQRFLSEVRQTSDRLHLEFPTIFAWHGSPIYNWHTIIREGLHYKHADHGRAYGDGIYHGKDSNTSTGYTHYNAASRILWPKSVLRISAALALNEIVNAPSEFQSSAPYFVVQHLDWVQTRFLFVQCAPLSGNFHLSNEQVPKNQFPQDPQAIPSGSSGKISIPASAIQTKRAGRDKRGNNHLAQNDSPVKKAKLESGASARICDQDDNDDMNDDASDVTDDEDRDILRDDPPAPILDTGDGQLALRGDDQSTLNLIGTDFEPGKLDFTTLPIMPVPTYATSGTTTCLMRELTTLQKVQEKSILAELGWYIDFDKIENVYQWIVELHSFHTFEVKGKRLPLADDMEEKKVKSIVLEVRFNKDYPYTPPYVRVIRPRFLPIAQGGGGHIVMGGAMCMELLTNTGWSSVSSMESVLMQIRLAIASEPFARLDKYGVHDYGAQEGASGYLRAARGHGWKVPPGFEEMAFGKAEMRS